MLETFHFNGAAVRTLVQDGEPWFVAADVARVLGYSNPRAAVARHVDEEDRGTVAIRDAAYETRATIVNESGLYALIFGSRLPAARAFKRWVTSEVLPTLRRTGAYVSPDATAEQLSALAAQIEAMRGDANHTVKQGENRGGVTLRALADEWGVPYPVAFEVAAWCRGMLWAVLRVSPVRAVRRTGSGWSAGIRLARGIVKEVECLLRQRRVGGRASTSIPLTRP